MISRQFTEEQTIPSGWRILIFGGVTVIMAFSFIMIWQTEWTTMPADEKPFLLTLLIGPLSTLMVFFVRLDVRITTESVEYKVYPFRKKFKVIPLSAITQIELMKPKGLKSFKGMGSHRNPNRTELNFGGKYTVILSLVKGRVVTFTTNKPQELSSFLKNLPEGGPMIVSEV